jgi:hypothetical protein
MYLHPKHSVSWSGVPLGVVLQWGSVPAAVSAETREGSWSRTARWSAVSSLGTSRRSCAATMDGAATRPGGSIEEQHCYRYSTSSSHPPMASLTEPHPPATASRPPRLPLPPLATAPPPHSSSPQPLPSTRRGEIHRHVAALALPPPPRTG